MIGALSNHLWQSTVFALAAGLVAAALRPNRASTRHAVWTAASLKFLLPFSLLMSLGSQLTWASPETRPPVAIEISPLAVAVDSIAAPFSDDALLPAGSATTPSTNWIPMALAGLWAAGCGAVVLVRVGAWRRVRATMRASAPLASSSTLNRAGVRVRWTADRVEPGVVGIWRPVLLVPAGIERHLTDAQLDAIVAHERCHIRRRDNLTAALHMSVEAIFWFHPVVWWISARLMRERERACDEHVLRELGTPQAYAEGIVSVCKLYVESPIACVSGVTGSDLMARLEAITMNLVGLELTRARKALLASTVAMAIAVPIGVGMMTAPLRAAAATAMTQERASTPQKFEVASVKPCNADSQPVVPGGRTGGGNGSFSPGRVLLNCFVVRNLIDTAYVVNRASKTPGDPLDAWPGRLGLRAEGPQRIRGGPEWVYAEKYTIEAKAAGLDPSDGRNPDRSVMLGPMLRNLLEDRFKLKVHTASEETPMFALTLAKGGLRIKPMAPGACTNDRSNGPIVLSDAASRGVLPTCGTVNGGPHGPNWRWEHGGQDLAVVATVLSGDLGIKVIDRTGVTDKFNISWEYLPDESTPGPRQWLETYGPDAASAPPAASLSTALEQQLGLRLEKITGTRAFIVIDHIARPTPDGPDALFRSPARVQGPGRTR